LAIESTMRSGLGAGATLGPQERAALVDRIVPSIPQKAGGARLILRWSWAAAAAAAVILAVVMLWPAHPHHPPVLLTDIFADLLGPLAQASTSAPETPTITQAADSEADPLGLSRVVSAVWGDIQGPLTIGLDAMEAPRAAASVPPSAAILPKAPTREKEK
jgi:hypothetical protein